jgi:hypothetical protein
LYKPPKEDQHAKHRQYRRQQPQRGFGDSLSLSHDVRSGERLGVSPLADKN